MPSIKRNVHHTQWVTKLGGVDADRSETMLVEGRANGNDNNPQAKNHALPRWWPQADAQIRAGYVTLRHATPDVLSQRYKDAEAAWDETAWELDAAMVAGDAAAAVDWGQAAEDAATAATDPHGLRCCLARTRLFLPLCSSRASWRFASPHDVQSLNPV